MANVPTQDLTREVVMTGIAFSMESACIVLQNANKLYKVGQTAAAIVLGAIAVEHIGSATWLWGQLTQAANGKASLDCEGIRTKLKKRHETKLDHGIVAHQSEIPASLSLSRLERLQPDSQEHREALEETWNSVETLRKRLPAEYFRLRTQAQYVDLEVDCRNWTRPAQANRKAAHKMLMDAGSSYRTVLLSVLLKHTEFRQLVTELDILKMLIDDRDIWPTPEGNVHTNGPGSP